MYTSGLLRYLFLCTLVSRDDIAIQILILVGTVPFSRWIFCWLVLLAVAHHFPWKNDSSDKQVWTDRPMTRPPSILIPRSLLWIMILKAARIFSKSNKFEWFHSWSRLLCLTIRSFSQQLAWSDACDQYSNLAFCLISTILLPIFIFALVIFTCHGSSTFQSSTCPRKNKIVQSSNYMNWLFPRFCKLKGKSVDKLKWEKHVTAVSTARVSLISPDVYVRELLYVRTSS
jgi:hypothetical protein